ncbi:MarR family transcriptional regulator [Pseudonocardia humida]|uniref:MarR family transcriptional regulator n=1 Tax=Pseudonocardia humida TaxID=2800819 RepID=A0ABT0ZZX2_9PSEU|nr:MarR family transcriptional regulator [Pseudonocardia humida]MCO1656305.1 MarR family transcriptional regulator [Pseudonocardia humida]
MGLPAAEAALLGADDAVRVRTFRLLLVLAQQLRTLMDQRLRGDGLTTQQAALITVVDALGAPKLSEVAAGMGTTHQNAKQVAAVLERKGFVVIEPDPRDRRVRRVRTTELSRAHWGARSADDQRYVLEWFADLSAEQARTLFDLLLVVRKRASDGVRSEDR